MGNLLQYLFIGLFAFMAIRMIKGGGCCGGGHGNHETQDKHTGSSASHKSGGCCGGHDKSADEQ